MHLGDIRGRRGQSGADRPHRLVGDHEVLRRRTVRDRAVELRADDVECPARHALILGLADADDRDQAGAPGRLRLGVHGGIRLAVINAALRVADDHGARAGVLQHFGRDVARESA